MKSFKNIVNIEWKGGKKKKKKSTFTLWNMQKISIQ